MRKLTQLLAALGMAVLFIFIGIKEWFRGLFR